MAGIDDSERLQMQMDELQQREYEAMRQRAETAEAQAAALRKVMGGSFYHVAYERLLNGEWACRICNAEGMFREDIDHFTACILARERREATEGE